MSKYTIKEFDEFRNITYYKNKSESDDNPIMIYIGKRKNNKLFLRVIFKYLGDDWLFVDSLSVSVDGKIYGPFTGKFERDHSSGRVWEWIDISVNKVGYELLNKIFTSQRSVIRFDGSKYYRDQKIDSNNKRLIKEMIYAYRDLGGKDIN